ncbi:uncharacterized protein EDB91DRAFT_1174846 [Suillus paluster]|uniref:uncharacterized protein n=1 Tax=Suillus paluster TaxID=48578 RepID=UPI001B881E20|nr:uncharacterized protein EDB91DRAFT_1174846 [Suillus paluster]KAG1722381.1 hypothetical protein EDB91DRAFT_1174846 [Suillus paluster]
MTLDDYPLKFFVIGSSRFDFFYLFALSGFLVLVSSPYPISLSLSSFVMRCALLVMRQDASSPCRLVNFFSRTSHYSDSCSYLVRGAAAMEMKVLRSFTIVTFLTCTCLTFSISAYYFMLRTHLRMVVFPAFTLPIMRIWK